MSKEILGVLPENLKPLFVSMHNEIVRLQEENYRLRRAQYASRSEKHISGILIEPVGTLFNESEVAAATEDSGSDPEPPAVPLPDVKKKRVRSPESGGRKPLPPDLPRERVIHDISESEKTCRFDGDILRQIGEEVVEKIEFIPSTLKVIQHVYPKYACDTCEGTFVQSEAEPVALPGIQAGPGLLAHIIVCKYLLALPLYRQEAEFTEMGFELSRTTMARWVIKTHDFLFPLLTLLKNFILSRGSIHADETTVQVLKEKGKPPQSKSYMWTLCSGEHDVPAVWFEYHASRSGRAALNLLNGFNGLLHIDGYDGYTSVTGRGGVIRLGCWAHVRRKFDVAKKDGAATGQRPASLFLDAIQRLFLVEREAAGKSPEQIREIRHFKSRLIVAEIRTLLDAHLTAVTPKSKLGMALNYLKNEWPWLIVFLDHGQASLSNNRMENYIRPFVTGRKNWLFADTPAGAAASAGLYSLLISARANGLDARAYLTALLTEIPAALKADPSSSLDQWLPWNWKNNK